MAGLLSVPATRGERRGAGRREGPKGRSGRAGGERRAKEGRRKSGGGEEALWSPARTPRRDRRDGPPGRGRPEAAGAGRSAGRGCGAGLPHPPTSPDRAPERVRRPARTASATLAGGPVRGAPRVLLACGRAPGRALWLGPCGSACMVLRGSARCTGHSGLGEHRRLIPRRRRTGPGGGPRLPDRATSRVARWPPHRAAGRRPGSSRVRPGTGEECRRPERTGEQTGIKVCI